MKIKKKDPLKVEILIALSALSISDQRVLEMRFGLVMKLPKSRHETAHKFGITYEDVRQIESEAGRTLGTPRWQKLLKFWHREDRKC